MGPKILIQQADTSLFFKSIGGWTPNPDEAFDFERTHIAVRFCQVNEFQNVQVLSWHKEGFTDFLMKVSPRKNLESSA